jgi:Fe-S-cluster containining protein
MVSPKLAVGIVKPDEIISYQLNVDTCPHLDEKNECKIYYGRPLICKAFPYISGRMSRKCPQIGNQMIIETDLWAIDAEIEASKKLDRYILNRTEKLAQKRRNQKVWEFDLAEKKWIFRKSLS